MKTKGLMKSAGIYTGSNIVTAAIPFLLLPILTRVLSPADYGIVAMFGIMVSIFSAFTGLGAQGALEVRYFEQERIDLPRYAASCLLILMASTAMVLLCTFLSKGILESMSGVPGDWLMIAVLVAAMQFVVLARLLLWQVSKQAWKYGAMQIGQSGLNAGLSLWLVLVIGLAWEGRTLGIVIASAIVMVIAAASLWRDGWIRSPISLEYIKDALRFGVPLIPHMLGGLLIAAVDRIMVTNILGVSQTGIYTVAMQIGMVLSLLTGAFNRAYAPWLFEHLKNRDGAQKIQIVRYTYLYFLLLIVMALSLGLLAPAILSVLVGEAFRTGAEVVIYVAAGFAFGGMYFMVTNYVFLAGATARLAIITLTSGVINVVATYLLISKFGLAGAGYGFMGSQAVLFLGTWYLANKVWPMPWKKALTEW
ncbi:MAG: oligosaccharide flippase family protein [Burkholderiales bacterium]|nr:oligosaccharide flippase family protein [Burkholderiales bacterium]